ncbi:MAG: hypothetical protein JNM24_13460 [Bdellovibrionaceae bacterium]|nr:hypothetical protein [Pseudobdellovibrionaceae bacterium]
MFVVVPLTLTVLFTNCSKSSNTPSDPPVSTSSNNTIQWLQESNYNFVGVDYPMKMGRFQSGDLSAPVYVQWVANGCSSQCRTLVIVNPYGGIDWSGEAADQKWLDRPNAANGYIHADDEGPGYIPGASVGTLFYKKQTPAEGVGMGAVFLPNKVSLLVVSHRFYLGRNLKDYIQEFQRVVSFFVEQGTVDTNRMAFFGASLGGFISLHSALDFKYPPKALALLTPLIDLKKQVQFIDGLSGFISDPAVVAAYTEFFEPYLRRVFDFTGGRPAHVPAAYSPYTVEGIAPRLKSKALILHDTWDTLTPVSEAISLQQQTSALSELLLYQHATGISWNTFEKDHSQKSEGLNQENTWPFYSLFIYNHLLDPSETIVLYYDYLKFSTYFLEVKAAAGRAQNISGIKNRMLDLCSARARMIDYTGQIGEVSGRFYVQQIMKNIWGFSRPEITICDDLKTFTF